MSDDVLGRISGDLDVMQRALGLRLSFGKGMLVVNMLLAAAAIGAALLGLQVETEWVQHAIFATIVILVPTALYLGSARTCHEINSQIGLSVTIYATVWIAACGYKIAVSAGPAIGTVRSALLYATSISLLTAFTVLLVRAALRNRDRHYCLGLALATLLSGMVMPIIDQRFSCSIAHGLMAVGYLTALVVQSVQLREAATGHAAN